MSARPDTQRGPHTAWFKSSFSPSQGGCVEVRFAGQVAYVRDTKDLGSGPVISVPITAWPGFIDEVLGKAIANSNTAFHIAHQPDGSTQLHALDYSATLTFNSNEWTAFKAGAVADQFILPIAV